MWNALFTATNLLAIVGWLLLAAAPRKPAVRSLIMYLGVALLCLTYTVLFALFLSGSVDPVRVAGAGEPGFGSIPGVRALFASDGGVVIGWTHYLAFDLFTGMWIASDADNKGFGRLIQVPVLLTTFMAGPVGLLAWLILREGRARSQNRTAPK